MRKHFSFFIISAVLLFSCGRSHGAELKATDWIQMSQKTSESLFSAAAPTNFQTIQLLLSQAMAYSAAGDTEKLKETLQRIQAPGAKWLSGGDGMMRQVLVESEILDIHKLTLSVLAKEKRFNDALTYCLGLAETPNAEEIFFFLGRQLKSDDNIPGKAGTPTPQLYTAMQIGVVSWLVDHSQQETAAALVKQIDRELQKQIINRMIQILLLDKSWDSFNNLFVFSANQELLEQNTLLFALNQLTIAKKNAQIVPLLALLPHKDDSLQSALALSYITAKHLDLAEKVFNNAPKKNLRKWETVAVALKKDDWLLEYYQTLTNPWRKTERLYQLAKRMLEDGVRDKSLHIAEIAVESASHISSDQTRSTAHTLLARYFALLGDVNRTQQMTRLIAPSKTRNLQKATAQLANAQMKNGNLKDATQTALSIENDDIRGDALVLVAEAADREEDYAHIVTIAEQNFAKISERRSREKAWLKLAQMQLQQKDYSGVEKSIRLASLSDAGAAAAEALIAHSIQEQSFDKAFSVAQLIPDIFDPTRGYNRRQRSFQNIITAIAATREGRRAMEEMHRITEKSTWDMTTPAVARALADQGDFHAIATLLETIQRSDARGEVVSLLLLTQLKAGTLPEYDQLAKLPKRGMGRYCWAAAVFSQTNTQTFTSWLEDIPSESCRSFACAGKAFAITSPPEFRNPDTLSRMFEPAQMKDQVMNTMLRQSLKRSGF